MPDQNNYENLRAVYAQLCSSYLAIDQFRGMLLGLLPLASGAGIFLLIREPDKPIDPLLLPPIGAFGFVIALGLFIFEIYGIRRCTHLIVLGKHLEKRLGADGQFQWRPNGIEGFGLLPKGLARYVNEPLAAGVIYPAVLGGWAYMAFWKTGACLSLPAVLVGLVIFITGCLAMFGYNTWLKKDAEALGAKLEEKLCAAKIAAQDDERAPKGVINAD